MISSVLDQGFSMSSIGAGPLPSLPVLPGHSDEPLQIIAQAAQSDPAPDVRQKATTLLVQARAPQAAFVVETQLSSPDRRLRLGALQALLSVRGQGVVPSAVLESLTKDPDGYVREAAGRLIGGN